MNLAELINAQADNITEKYKGAYVVSDEKRAVLMSAVMAADGFVERWNAANVDVDFEPKTMGFVVTMETFYIEEQPLESDFIADVLMEANGLRFEVTDAGRARWIILLPGIWKCIAS